jgi:hypothetical protein
VSGTGIARARGRRVAALLIAGCLVAEAVALLGQQLLPTLSGAGDRAAEPRPAGSASSRTRPVRSPSYGDQPLSAAQARARPAAVVNQGVFASA